MKIWTLASLSTLGLFAGLSGARAEQVYAVTANFASLVGEQVLLTDCTLNRATSSSAYCNGAESATIYIYIDGATMDPTDLARAQAECAGYDVGPECRVTLTGTVGASFGSPIITNARVSWSGGQTAPRQAAADGLRSGEYACYGQSSQVLAGLGFIASPDGTYTDLDQTTMGYYAVSGSDVMFDGGHLDGETGRDLDGNGAFVIGSMAVCEPW